MQKCTTRLSRASGPTSGPYKGSGVGIGVSGASDAKVAAAAHVVWFCQPQPGVFVWVLLGSSEDNGPLALQFCRVPIMGGGGVGLPGVHL